MKHPTMHAKHALHASLQGPSPRRCACGQHIPCEEMLQWWRAVATLSDLTSPRLEPQTSCSTDERITAPLSGPLD